MWYGFLDQWTGISFFMDNNIVSAAKFDLNTDASSAIGFGGYFRNKWFQGWFRFRFMVFYATFNNNSVIS